MDISGKDYIDFSSPCVYEWIRGCETLYIGASSNGLARPLVHNIINKIEPVLPTDIIKITKFDTAKEAFDFEKQAIISKKPKYNITYCHTPTSLKTIVYRKPSVKKINKQNKILEYTVATLPSFKVCITCKGEFKPRKPWQNYCTRSFCIKNRKQPVLTR